MVVPGKVAVFNVIQNVLSIQRILSIKTGSTIIFVYDTDIKDDSKLKENISILKRYGFNNIIHIQQVSNFEDEILYCSNIKSINQIFNTEGIDEFKQRFIHSKNIINKLETIGFDINKIWTRKDNTLPFSKYVKNYGNDIIKRR